MLFWVFLLCYLNFDFIIIYAEMALKFARLRLVIADLSIWIEETLRVGESSDSIICLELGCSSGTIVWTETIGQRSTTQKMDR